MLYRVLVYAKNIDLWQRYLIPRDEQQLKAFKNPDNDPRGPWQSVSYSVQSEDSERRREYRYQIQLPSGRKVMAPAGRHWNGLIERTMELRKDNRLWFGKNGDNPPRLKVFLSEVQPGIVPDTWWTHKECGSNQDSKKEMLALFPGIEPFNTPKPERLIKRILDIATKKGDLVVDSFLGSGTTAAVAHKMERRYIGIEIGEHAVTYCAPRLKKVINSEQGGISEIVNWQGGGGFRFYRLGESVFDEYGHINENIRYPILAAHIWFTETNMPLTDSASFPLLGIHSGTAYYLLFNGVLGDKSPSGGNVLTSRILRILPPFDGPKVIYGETTRFGADRLKREGITFKQIPYEIKAR